MASCCSVLLTIVFIFTIIASVTRVSSSTRNFTIVNSCKETIWLGITHSENISGGGFELKPRKSTVYTASSGYAYDDPTSIITCSGANYVVAFCASRNQTVCSYHDNQLFCNQSKGLKVVPHRWWVAVLAIPLMLKLCVMF
nr:hypothetical protein CFP56_55651 [Quercus suber]